MTAPASTRDRAPTVTNGPICAPGSTMAAGSTTADGWIPGATGNTGSNSAAIFANAA